MKVLKAFPLSFFLLLSTHLGSAQLIVNDGPTAQQLLQNVLVGNGVQVSNVTFTGDPLQIGSFDAANAKLPYDSGVVMSTGQCVDAAGPNDLPGESTFFNNYAGDPDLLSIAQATNTTDSINDAAIIEFDFVPQGDTVSFDFIFGSEEYMDYVGEPFNDVFGFFLSGPGINGPYQNNAINLAQIPGTNDPISISDVNANTNSAFYIDNGDGSIFPYDSDPSYIQANGRTVSLTANDSVSCGQTYHLALKIGDGQDASHDSWVFLKGGSLTSTTISASTDLTYEQNDSTIWEGCGSASFDITREGDTNSHDTVLVETRGSATEGSDYAALPDTLFFQPGDDTLQMTFDALADNQAEGIEEGLVDLIYRDRTSCATWDTTTVDLYIQDPPAINTNTNNDTIVPSCGGPVDLWASANGGIGNYRWEWDQGIPPGDSTGTVTPASTTTYGVSVEDTCGTIAEDSVQVTVPDSLQVDLRSDTTICVGGTAVLNANATGGTPGYTYHWDQGLGGGQVHAVSPGTETEYSVYVEDQDGCTSDPDTLTVSYYDSLEVNIPDPRLICPGDTVQLVANASGGESSSYQYDWSTGGITPGETVAPTSSSSYSVTVEDDCETPPASDTVQVDVNPLPNVAIDGYDLEGCSPVEAKLVNATPPSEVGGDCIWDFGDGTQGFGCDTVTHTYQEAGCYDVTLTLRSPDGCVDSTTRTNHVCVDPYPDADFDPDPEEGSVLDPEISFTNRTSGAVAYEWDFAGIGSSSQEHPSYTFPNDRKGSYDVCLKATSLNGCQDSICKEVRIQGEFIVYVPNAFTPDGDGVNDEFKPVVQGENEEEYRFTVYDRWGEVVFETGDPEEGWNGSIDGSGSASKTDVYVWKLVTKNERTGEDVERRGQVTVIH